MRTLHFTSLDQLQEHAAAWDDLWWRSDVALPTARAELTMQWIEHFAPGARLHLLVAEHGGEWLAALPLVEERLRGVLPAASLPGNAWSPCGELLVDPSMEPERAVAALVEAARSLRRAWLWLPEVPLAATRWQQWQAACGTLEAPLVTRERFLVPRIEIGDDWQAFLAGLSRSHRQRMAKAMRRFEQEGPVTFEARSDLEVHEVEPWLQEGFEVEDRSWKGKAGSSVLGAPRMFQFFLRQAEQLARFGQLEVAMLRLQERPVAFLYGYRAKGVYYAFKIGYDPQFAAHSPGQLLLYQLFERLHRDPECHAVDCMGPLSETINRWRPASYVVGRVIVASRSWLGRGALAAYCRLRHDRSLAETAEANTAPAESAAVAETAS
ncbi:MAG: GNAT family N-acetyltransferase [Planctomycetota bacterium]